MRQIMQQPQEVQLMDPLEPIPPQAYPGCEVCTALSKEWVALTEPASPSYDTRQANKIRLEINSHRKEDEKRAPAL